MGRIGPKAKDAVPALTNLLELDGSAISRNAVEALGSIGPDAKEAVPRLIRVLEWRAKHSKPYSSNSTIAETIAVVETLGKIGPAANAAVPILSQIEGMNANAGLFVGHSEEQLLAIKHAKAALEKIQK